MNKNSRIKNSTLNFVSSLFLHFFSIISAFIIRRVFIKSLGVEFLGIAGLFNNILAVLSLAEMGIGSVMAYSMYKAIANADEEKLAAINNYYRNIYNRIAIVVFSIGLLILPFLQFIVNLDRAIPHLYIYYVLEVFNSAISYVLVYKTAIVNADQSGYKLSWLSSLFSIIKTILQVISLLIFKKYMIYLLIGIGITLTNNLIKSIYAEKLYPFIKNKDAQLSTKEKEKIWTNIKSMLMYKISGVILNNTDNILISIIINTNMVGVYSNYTMINNKLHGILAMFFGSLYSSIGNINAVENNKKKIEIFNTLCLLSFWLYAFGTIGYLFCGEDVIKMISGSNAYVMSKSVLIACVLLFYLNVPVQPILLYRETAGIFKYGKYSIVAAALLNIILSIILGNFFGLFGIIIATSISKVLTNVWYEPYVLYKKIFKESPRSYFSNQLLFVVLAIITVAANYIVIEFINFDNLYLRLFTKIFTCTLITNLLFFAYFRKTYEFKYIREKCFLVLKKVFNK